MGLKIELPEILDDKHPIAHLITVLDKEGNTLGRIKSLNTKTLQAKIYTSLDRYRIEKNKDGEVLTEEIQLEDITIRIK